MAKIRKGSQWMRGFFGAAAVFLFTFFHLSPPAWASDEREAIRALNQKIDLLMTQCSKDKAFDDSLIRNLQSLDAVVTSYTDGDTKMGKFLGDQPGGSN